MSQKMVNRETGPKICDELLKNAIVDSRIMSAVCARRLLDSGCVTLQSEFELERYPKIRGIERGIASRVQIRGHLLTDLQTTHYVMNKPAGVSADGNYSWEGVGPFLPFPTLSFGYTSAIERSSCGVLLLLNDIRIQEIMQTLRPLRKYFVRVDPLHALSPAKVSSLKQGGPFSDVVVEAGSVRSLLETFPNGASNVFTVSTRDYRPHLVRTLFGSVGSKVEECRLESIGGVSLTRFELTKPGDSRLVDMDTILELLHQ